MKKRSHHALLRLENTSRRPADSCSSQCRNRHGHRGRNRCPTAQQALPGPAWDRLRRQRDEKLLLRDPRQLRMLLHRGGAGGVSLRGRLEAIDLGHQVCGVQHVPVRSAQLLPGRGLRRAGDVGKGALPGIRVVHPLGEEAAVKRHAATVVRSDLLQALHQRGGQRPRRLHRGRREALDEADDCPGQRVRLADVCFQRLHQGLALANAAHRVELRTGKAVRGAVDVVGNDDAGLRRVRLV
mmetsp:Transcript_4880/g.14224  ORF Transcript_4880/g.14224 Transcript_4880/m.14224 type:complete len:240 (+) Transcript_4880:70-789(+)